LIELTYLIGWKFDEWIWKIEKSVEEFCLHILSEVKRGWGYNEESIDMMYWNEPTSFSFVDDLVREVSQRITWDVANTPVKNISFKETENKPAEVKKNKEPENKKPPSCP